MKDSQIILIAVPIFIILLVVIFRVIKDSLKFDTFASLILSACVSALATIGINSNIKGMVGVVLIPYATLGICILVIVFLTFLFKGQKNGKDMPAKPKDRLRYNVDKPQINKSGNDRMNR